MDSSDVHEHLQKEKYKLRSIHTQFKWQITIYINDKIPFLLHL